MVVSCLDEILKELFDYFKDTTKNELGGFEAKVIQVESITEALNKFPNNKGRHVKFSLPHDFFYGKPDTLLMPNQILSIENEYNMGDTLQGVYNSTIYNRSTSQTKNTLGKEAKANTFLPLHRPRPLIHLIG